MSKTGNRQSCQPMEVPFMKVNEIINSIFGMNQGTVAQQLGICSKMGVQLLQNESINQISSLNSAKLLCYELVLLISQANFAQSAFNKQNCFSKNKNFQLSTSMRSTLALIDQSLNDLLWDQKCKQRGGTQRHIVNCTINQAYAQFKNLRSDFDTLVHQQQQSQGFNSSVQRLHLQSGSSSSEENEALIEQLEEIISNKQKRIKQMTEQLEQLILEQKTQEDLISELESRNVDLQMEVRSLGQKISYFQKSQLDLQEKLSQRKGNYDKDQQFNEKLFKIDASKIIKTNYTDWHEEQKTEKKEIPFQFDERSLTCESNDSKMAPKYQEFCSLKAMLLAQALSIEALIT